MQIVFEIKLFLYTCISNLVGYKTPNLIKRACHKNKIIDLPRNATLECH